MVETDLTADLTNVDIAGIIKTLRDREYPNSGQFNIMYRLLDILPSIFGLSFVRDIIREADWIRRNREERTRWIEGKK